MPKAWLCKVCFKELTGNYHFPAAVDTVTHRGEGNCNGIGQSGSYGEVPTRKFVKDQQRSNNTAKQSKHYANKSGTAMEKYQSPHHNADEQRRRVNAAVEQKLPGHASHNSNSGMNNGTATKLRNINGKK